MTRLLIHIMLKIILVEVALAKTTHSSNYLEQPEIISRTKELADKNVKDYRKQYDAEIENSVSNEIEDQLRASRQQRMGKMARKYLLRSLENGKLPTSISITEDEQLLPITSEEKQSTQKRQSTLNGTNKTRRMTDVTNNVPWRLFSTLLNSSPKMRSQMAWAVNNLRNLFHMIDQLLIQASIIISGGQPAS